ncbi:hypothetical protein [Thermococcus sp.]
MSEMELEFIGLIEEKKKEVKPGMFGKGKAEDFFKARLEVYGESYLRTRGSPSPSTRTLKR